MDASLKNIGLLSNLQQQMLLITEEDITASEPGKLLPEELQAKEEFIFLGVLSKELKAMWALGHKLTIKEEELQRNLSGFSNTEESAQVVIQEMRNIQNFLDGIDNLIFLFMDWDFPRQDNEKTTKKRRFWVDHEFKACAYLNNQKVSALEA